MDRLLGLRAKPIVVAAVAYLLFAWTLVAVIDVYDVAGLRSSLGRDDGGPVWIHLFGEARVTEMLQWLLLATVSLVAAIRAGELRQLGNTRGARFFTLIGVSAALMLIEDAGNPSHQLVRYAEDILGTSGFTIELLFRAPVFIVIGAVPLYAFIRYWPSVARGRPGGGFLLGGVAAYGVAAFSSVPANLLFDYYTRVGPWLTDRVLGGRLLLLEVPPRQSAEFSSPEYTSALFMDYVYEESIELVGAALLLAGVLALGQVLTKSRESVAEPATHSG